MIQLREKKEGWTVPLAALETPLQKGMLFIVQPAALVMPPDVVSASVDEKKQVPVEKLLTWIFDRPAGERFRKKLLWLVAGRTGEADNSLKVPLECTLVNWYWTVGADRSSTLELMVEKARTPFLDRLLQTDGSRSTASTLLVLLGLLILVVVGVFARYNPEFLWFLAGRNVRWLVGWSIGLLFVFYLPSRFRVTNSTTFRSFFLSSILIFSGAAGVVGWLSFARFPPGVGPGSPHGAFASFAHTLATKFAKSYWPIVLAGLPWVALAFKVTGFEAAEKAVSGLASAAKHKE